jgi:hypothetical protein
MSDPNSESKTHPPEAQARDLRDLMSFAEKRQESTILFSTWLLVVRIGEGILFLILIGLTLTVLVRLSNPFASPPPVGVLILVVFLCGFRLLEKELNRRARDSRHSWNWCADVLKNYGLPILKDESFSSLFKMELGARLRALEVPSKFRVQSIPSFPPVRR